MLCLLYVLHLTAYAFEVTTNAQRAQNKYGAEGKQLMKANRLSLSRPKCTSQSSANRVKFSHREKI